MVVSWFINLILLVFVSTFNIPFITNVNNELSHYSLTEKNYSLGADKAVVLSEDGRSLYFAKNADKKQPIASITKLMTAIVFLETNPNWSDTYTITREDYVSGGRINLYLGDTVEIKDLFLTSLVPSDNGATIALVHASGLEYDEFVSRMNEKAKEMRLLKTSFVDPTGLSSENISTAREVALLAKEAFEKKEIREALILKEYSFTTKEGREKHLESTDYLLFDKGDYNFEPLGGKTGYTEKAGYCFVGMFENKEGDRLIASILNSDSKNGRFEESKSIIRYVLESYFSKEEKR